MTAIPLKGGFPCNKTVTVNMADWIERFIRKNGIRAAIQHAGDIGLTSEEIAEFHEMNRPTYSRKGR